MRPTFPRGGHRLYDYLVGRPLARFYGRLASRLPPGRVLDVGCGPGHLAGALHDGGRDVVAVDLDPRQVRIAAKNHRGLDVRQGDAAELPFDDEVFDVVVTSESYHHWEDKAAGVREAHRVLRPGGSLVVIEGCGDVRKDEVRAFMGRAPPGMTWLCQFVFRTHGFTPDALGPGLLDVLAASPFGDAQVERIDGWWVVTATKPT